jgi:uncharacterized membrane protein HdeD (DUF308 family)
MTQSDDAEPSEPVRRADRSYGVVLILLGLVSAAAPFFVAATLAWTLFLAGLIAAVWLWLDRTPRGRLAAAIWSLVAFALGAHLVFHLFLGLIPLTLTLGIGFVLLGAAEIAFGLERYSHTNGARLALVLGGAAAVIFGICTALVWQDMPAWAAGVTVGLMFAAFGVALELGAAHHRAQLRAG